MARDKKQIAQKKPCCRLYLLLRLHWLQLVVILTHFPHKFFFQPQNLIQLNQLFRELGLPQCVEGCKSFRGILSGSRANALK